MADGHPALRPATSIADPNNPTDALVPNLSFGQAVTKSDATVYNPPLLALYVGTTGDVAVHPVGNAANSNVTFSAVPGGALIPIKVDMVLSTGTTASNILGLR